MAGDAGRVHDESPIVLTEPSPVKGPSAANAGLEGKATGGGVSGREEASDAAVDWASLGTVMVVCGRAGRVSSLLVGCCLTRQFGRQLLIHRPSESQNVATGLACIGEFALWCAASAYIGPIACFSAAILVVAACTRLPSSQAYAAHAETLAVPVARSATAADFAVRWSLLAGEGLASAKLVERP